MTEVLPDYATNLRRLMAREGLTLQGVVDRTGLDERTIKGILNGTNNPQPRTLHKLSTGLNVPADELFQDPSLLTHRLFDRRTNPLVEEVVSERADLVQGWTEADFDELYSHFGMGGALTPDGVIEIVNKMNRHRTVHHKVAVLLETSEAELLINLVDVLYARVVVSSL